MTARHLFALGLISLFASCGSPGTPDSSQPGSAADLAPTFSSLNETVFQPKCVGCHNANKHESGVDLSSHAAIMASSMTHGDSVVAPGDPSKSHLYKEVADGSMPPSGKLPDSEVQAIRAWIEQGAQNN